MRIDGRRLSLTFGSVEINCDSTSIVLDNEDADAELVTFGDVVAGNDKRWFFTVSGLPDYGAGSFWSLLWDTPAYVPIPYEFNPYGVDAPTTSTPVFTGEVTVDRKPPIGGEAGARWAFDARLTCTENPTRVTT
jgi:hypothetical protein